MWRLSTLGGLSIERVDDSAANAHLPPSAPAAVAQRRPLALLAVLAASGERGVPRDDLLLYFWPDSNVERAKNALRQTTFRLRRDLGPPDPIVGNNELQLDPAAITSDAAEFEANLAEGRIKEAVALYRGPFLQAVSIGTAPEFDRWVAAQRARLAQRFAAAVESLASAASARGEHHAAITWWQRLATTDPTSSRVAVGLMTALAESGDRDGALQYSRLHELLLQEELGVGADETVIALVNKLRAAPVLNSNAMSEVILPAVTGSSVAVAAASNGQSPATAQRQLAGRRRGAGLAIAVGALALAVIIGRRVISSENAPEPPPSPAMIAIFPFVPRGDMGNLGVAASDLLDADLDGMASLHVVDRRQIRQTTDSARSVLDDPARANTVARRFGAGQFLLGEVTGTANAATVSATLYSFARGSTPTRIAEISTTGRRDDIAGITSDLARRLLATLYSSDTTRLTHSAALTTHSLSALKAYLDGERHFQNGAFAPAVEAYRRAVAEDTTFAIGYYRLAVAADWASHPTLPTEALGRAIALAPSLPEYEQRLVYALAAWRQGRGADAIRLYRSAVAEYPDDVEAWYQLGEALYHSGPAYGQSVLEARPAFERAVHFRPGAREALVHLVRLAAKARDTRAVDSLTRRVMVMDTTADATELRLFRSMAMGHRDSVNQLLDSLRRSPDEAVLSAAWRAAVFAEDLAVASAIARLLIDPTRSVGYQATGRWYVASLDLAGGSWKAARAMLAPSLATLGTPNASGSASSGPATAGAGSVDAIHAEQLGLMAAMPLLPLSSGELDILRRHVAASPGAPPDLAYWPNLLDTQFRDYVLGLLAVKAGDTTAALRSAIALDRIRGDSGVMETAHSAALTLRAQVAHAAGEHERALALLDAAPVRATLHSVLPSRAYERFLRAELLRELGRDDEASRWYATQGQSFVPDMIYLAPAELRQAEIRERHGDLAGARAHYRRFIELWGACDPELEPLVKNARNRLRSLEAK